MGKRHAIRFDRPTLRLVIPTPRVIGVGDFFADEVLDQRPVVPALGAVRGGARIELHAGQSEEVEPFGTTRDEHSPSVVTQFEGGGIHSMFSARRSPIHP